jgi:hypothetical protein
MLWLWLSIFGHGPFWLPVIIDVCAYPWLAVAGGLFAAYQISGVHQECRSTMQSVQN